jgi:thymidine kinase
MSCQRKCGSICLIFGSMFAGKTGELLRRKRRAELANKKCLMIKYYKDTRYSVDKIATHDMITSDAVISDGNSLGATVGKVDNLSQYQCVFVDEIQFFTDGAEVCDHLANMGMDVTVCGLQGDYNRVIFPTIAKLIPMTETFVPLTAIDSVTGHDASFTARITQETGQEIIGGKDKYIATDRQHYFEIMEKQLKT